MSFTKNAPLQFGEVPPITLMSNVTVEKMSLTFSVYLTTMMSFLLSLLLQIELGKKLFSTN